MARTKATAKKTTAGPRTEKLQPANAIWSPFGGDFGRPYYDILNNGQTCRKQQDASAGSHVCKEAEERTYGAFEYRVRIDAMGAADNCDGIGFGGATFRWSENSKQQMT